MQRPGYITFLRFMGVFMLLFGCLLAFAGLATSLNARPNAASHRLFQHPAKALRQYFSLMLQGSSVPIVLYGPGHGA